MDTHILFVSLMLDSPEKKIFNNLVSGFHLDRGTTLILKVMPSCISMGFFTYSNYEIINQALQPLLVTN